MKLHLLLLASLFQLSNGFMVELKGPLSGEACTGTEYADFKTCVVADPGLPALNVTEEEAFVSQGPARGLLSYCAGCPGGSPRGSFCFTFCGRRRLSEEGTDTPNVRRVEEEEGTYASYESGDWTGTGDALVMAEDIIKCLGDVATNHPCLGSTDTMTLVVILYSK
jgi:hypothetical protein